MEEIRKFKIWYVDNYPGSPNPGEVKEKVIETTETKERLLQHSHIQKVEEFKEKVFRPAKKKK